MGEISLATSRDVAEGSATDLVSGSADLAAAVTAPGIGRPERISRARMATDAAAALPLLAAQLDPYASGEYSHGHDLIAASKPHDSRARDAAADRLAQYAQSRQLLAQVRAATWADLSGAQQTGVTANALPDPARFLAQVGVRAAFDQAKDYLSAPLGGLPEAVLDPPRGTELDQVSISLDGEATGFHTAALLVNESAQLDWIPAEANRLEQLFRSRVNVRLETAILADLAAGAPAAATLADAEAAIGALWDIPDLIVCHPADRPSLVRAYAAERIEPADRPALLPSAGAPAGTAYVLASTGVVVEVSEPLDMVATEPRQLGNAIAYLRYGRGRVRLPGVVQAVTVP